VPEGHFNESGDSIVLPVGDTVTNDVSLKVRKINSGSLVVLLDVLIDIESEIGYINAGI
jgi:hypothetical protein